MLWFGLRSVLCPSSASLDQQLHPGHVFFSWQMASLQEAPLIFLSVALAEAGHMAMHKVSREGSTLPSLGRNCCHVAKGTGVIIS